MVKIFGIFVEKCILGIIFRNFGSFIEMDLIFIICFIVLGLCFFIVYRDYIIYLVFLLLYCKFFGGDDCFIYF